MTLNDHVNRFDHERDDCDMYERKPMETAPKDRPVLLFNPMWGWYVSKYQPDKEEDEFDAWFWGVSTFLSYPAVNLDTFKLVLNCDYRLNYFKIIQFIEPRGTFKETFHYAGLGLTIALLGSDPELEEPDYYSWLFSQEIGYSWEGELTGVSSIRWQSTGLFESFDDSPYGSIGVELMYSSYIYLRYFWEFGWIL